MANIGAYPVDSSTDVGKLRIAFGDVYSVPLIPVVPGQQDYTDYSDEELQGFLDLGGSIEAAMAAIYLQMAGAAARESRSVKDFDLSIDLTKRAADLRAIAAMWQEKADKLDGDIFEVFSLSDEGCGRAELAPCRVGCGCGRLF